jgi:pimeloyl-ACP methyl ester carboxylesterase
MRLSLWQNTLQTDVEVRGDGPPLVYLHGPWGLTPDLGFVERLAREWTVYAPRHPGTTRGDPDGIHRLDSLHDLVVYYAELLDALHLDRITLMGHSVGGMLACELAAAMPPLVQKLVLMDSIGLWLDEHPVRNWMIMPEDRLREALFADPAHATAFFTQSTDPEDRADRIWALACTAKFIWPVPDKGLKRRIHRVNAPTLIIWGAEDGIAPSLYADEFARRIQGARSFCIEGAGHLPHLEQPEAVLHAIAAPRI